jgi:cell division septum initiation protein DivIVA
VPSLRVADWEASLLLNREGASRKDLVQAVEAADRAGAIVTEQVRSIIEAAESSAEEMRRNAQRDAHAIRQEASEAANRVLERLDAIEGPLGDLVAGLRRETDALNAEVDRHGAR